MPDTETKDETRDSSSLEGSSTTIDTASSDEAGSLEGQSSTATSTSKPAETAGTAKSTIRHKAGHFSGKFNIYLLLFIVVLLIAGGVVLVTALSDEKSKKEDKTTASSQTLSSDTLKQLANTDATVGDPKQVLNVQSNAVFAGKVLVRDTLEVAGQIRVGGALTLPGITVSGESNFDQVKINKQLDVAGDTSILGQLNVKRNISVSGGGTFGGAISAPQITTTNLQLLGDLNIVRHIATGGPTPGRTNGSSLGGGGTASVSGSDTGGSVNINTGSGASAGCMATVNFAQRYNKTPHVIITPVGSGAAGINYYINRTTANFSICSTNTPPANSSFGFDYFVVE